MASRGVMSEHSAPHTSAHIGRVEQMHCMLTGKARTMRIDLKCPDSLWDKFYLMAAHLHAKMPTKSLGGRMPYKIWHGYQPNYSYMHKIGCHSFIFILTHNPKVHPRSILSAMEQTLKHTGARMPRIRKYISPSTSSLLSATSHLLPQVHHC